MLINGCNNSIQVFYVMTKFCVFYTIHPLFLRYLNRKTPRVITTKGVTMWFVQNGLVQENEL